jgi:hypothetical protein
LLELGGIREVMALTEEVLHGMSFEEIDAHYQHVKVDARQSYLDLVLTVLHDSAIEEKRIAHDDVGFELVGGGVRGQGLKVRVEECRLPELVKEFKGEAPYKDYDAERSRLNNAKGRKAITVEDGSYIINSIPLTIPHNLE